MVRSLRAETGTTTLDAIEMARWNRGLRHPGLRCHSDAGSQFTSIRYGERLAEIGATPSIGSVGDSYDNALAETVNGYYKAELIRGPARTGPWKTIEEVELATLGWVHWHNTQRLHGYLDDLPPVEFEQHHAARTAFQDPAPGAYHSHLSPAGPQIASHSVNPNPAAAVHSDLAKTASTVVVTRDGSAGLVGTSEPDISLDHQHPLLNNDQAA